MTMSDEDDEDFTELVDYRGKRADLVGSPASGVPRFLVMKAAEDSAGLLDPEFVRSLITKEAPVPESTEAGETSLPNGIVLKGSPAAMAAFIHSASAAKKAKGTRKPKASDDIAKSAAEYEAVIKAKYSAEDKRKMLAEGHAIKNENGDPSYTIGDKDDLGKAIHAVGRGGPDHDHIRAYIIRRAKALGASKEIPDNWNADGSLKSGVSKETGVPDPVAKDSGPDLDILADPDPKAAGDPTDPGSSAWEQVDADTAAQWTAILAQARVAVGALIDREMTEAATVDPGDADNACDLQSVCDAIDYAIGVLAPFAVGEQSEADCAAADLQAIGKAAAGAGQPAQVVTGLVSVAKAGRVLSSANEERIRGAAKALQDVLASLPSAPSGGQPVAKQEGAAMEDGTQAAEDVAKAGKPASADDQAKDTGPADSGAASDHMGGDDAPKPKKPKKTKVKKAAKPVKVWDKTGTLAGTVAKADIGREIAKAGDTPPMAVFDAAGNLIGVVDPAKVQPISGATAPKPDAKPAAEPDKGTEQPPAPAQQDTQPATPDPANGGTDLQPQPSAQAGIPAEDVQKGTEVISQLREMLERYETGRQEVVAKQAADNDAMAAQLEDVRKRLATVEEQPAMPKVALNGVIPPAQMRGQDQGAGAREVDVAKARERKAELYAATGPEQARIAKEMQGDAVAYLEALHAGR